MEFLFVLALLFFLSLLFKKDKKVDFSGGAFMVERKKCPPHQWMWQDIVDQHGTKLGERMICKECGPLSKLLNGDME